MSWIIYAQFHFKCIDKGIEFITTHLSNACLSLSVNAMEFPTRIGVALSQSISFQRTQNPFAIYLFRAARFSRSLFLSNFFFSIHLLPNMEIREAKQNVKNKIRWVFFFEGYRTSNWHRARFAIFCEMIDKYKRLHFGPVLISCFISHTLFSLAESDVALENRQSWYKLKRNWLMIQLTSHFSVYFCLVCFSFGGRGGG